MSRGDVDLRPPGAHLVLGGNQAVVHRRALDTRRRYALVGRLRPHRGFFVMAVRQYPANLESAIAA